MNKNQKIWVGMGIVAVAILILWRWNFLSQKNANAITIGVAVGETGVANEWGQGEFQVFQMYVDDLNANGGINGQPVSLIVEDTKGTGDGTVSAVSKLINIDQVPVILGPTWGDSFQGAYPITESAKVAMISPSAALEVVPDKEKYTYLFSTWWPQAPEINIMTDYMKAHDLKSLAIINDHDSFDTRFADDLQSGAGSAGITVVDREQVPSTQNDFRTEILKIKQLHPDALFVEIQNVAGWGPLMKQVKELGLTTHVFGSSDAQNEDALSKFGTYMEGVTYPFVRIPTDTAYEDFVKEYQAKYNQLPSAPSTLNAYNAIAILVEALKEGARTGTEIRDALYKAKVAGLGIPEVSFDSGGQIAGAPYEMKMVHNSQFVTAPN